MAQQNKANLKSFFQTGFKPTQQNFADLIESSINRQDDGIDTDVLKNLTVSQGITLKNSDTNSPVGTIRYNGTTFQFKDGAGWKDLGTGSGTQWKTDVQGNINLESGNVGVGLAPGAAPGYKFEVTIGSTSTTKDQVRLGNAVFFAQMNTAYFSHKNQATTNNFALAHDATGGVTINSVTGKSILFTENNTTKVELSNGTLVIGGKVVVPVNNPPTPAPLLTVNGNAFKTTGANWSSYSDARLKTNISPFTDGLALLKKLNPINYKYNGKAGISSESENVGLIAQDVQKIFPYMIGTFQTKLNESDETYTEFLSLDTSALTFILVNAIKELDERLCSLEKNPKKKP